jgi:hypothetical protein
MKLNSKLTKYSIMKLIFFKKKQDHEKKPPKLNELIFQTHDLGHEVDISPYKSN